MDTTAFGSAPAARARAPSRPRACLSILPPEVKILIVVAIAEGGRLNTVGSFSDREPWRWDSEAGANGWNWVVQRTPMRALSMVNREFAALTEPYLWGSFDLATVHEWDLIEVLTDVLPSHGRHIKSLALKKLGNTNRRDIKSRFRGVPEPTVLYDNPATALSHRLFLLALAIATMTSLNKVSCTVSQLVEETAIPLSPSSPTGRRVRWTKLAAALAALGTRLVDLSIFSGGEAVDMDARPLASFLTYFPSLSHLRLSLPVRIEVQGRKSLISTLSSLRHLAHLDIDETILVDDAFAAASWMCPMELSLPDSLQFPSLFTLLGKLQASLNMLTLYPDRRLGSKSEGLTPPTGTPFLLPHLHTLILSTRHKAALLASFSSSSLHYLTINYVPFVGDSDWLAFVQSHATSLQRVTIGTIAGRSFGVPGHDLQSICEARGIMYEVEATPDDEEEYEPANDNASDSSGDSYHEGGYKGPWDSDGEQDWSGGYDD